MTKKRSFKKKPAAKEPKKSQTQIANEKRVEAQGKKLDKAGTALMAGDKKKADKLVAAAAKPPKPLTGPQALERMTELQTLERSLEAIDHKIDGVKELYKELKGSREKIQLKMREEIRDVNKPRLEFGGPHPGTAKPADKDAKKPVDAKAGETKAAGGGTTAAKDGAKPGAGETKGANGETPVADIDADIAADAEKKGSGETSGANGVAAKAEQPAPSMPGKRRGLRAVPAGAEFGAGAMA